jgi:hypothetical protein
MPKDLMLMKLEKKQMIGIFLKKVEQDKPKEWQILQKKLKDDGNYVVADFICPTPEARNLFPADYIVWVDTIKEGRFDDTNKMFVKPEKFDYQVTTQDAKHWAPIILKEIK